VSGRTGFRLSGDGKTAGRAEILVMGETRPYELARATLVADLRRQKASPAGIQCAVEACTRHFTETTITRAAERGDNPNDVMARAIAETILELEREFTSGPEDPVHQALEIVGRVAHK
jgi:hypothetical protein